MKFSVVLFASAVIAAPASAPGEPGTVDKIDNTLGHADQTLSSVDNSVEKLDSQIGALVEHGDITKAVGELISNQGLGNLGKLIGNKKFTVAMGDSIHASASPDLHATTEAATKLLDDVTDEKRNAPTDLVNNSLFALLQSLHLNLATPVTSLSKRADPADLAKILETIINAYVADITSGATKSADKAAGQYGAPTKRDVLPLAANIASNLLASGILENALTNFENLDTQAPNQADSALKQVSDLVSNTVNKVTLVGEKSVTMDNAMPASN